MWLASLLLAGAEFFQFLAACGDLEALWLQLETQFVADFIFQFLNLVALELHDLLAVLADDMAVIRVIGVVGVVKFVVLAEIHLADETAFSEQRQRAIDRRA